MAVDSLRLARIHRRAVMLRDVRSFFEERGFLEVDTPLLSREVIPELHIEPMCIEVVTDDERRSPHWLQASPELCMKQLLAEGHSAVYQICKAFRWGESGRLHRPEFTMVEWYRAGDDLTTGIDLLDDLCRQVLDAPPAKRTTYKDAFLATLGSDPHTATCAELNQQAAANNVSIPVGMDLDNRDEWLNLLLTSVVESQLGSDGPEILYEYPATQSALAKTRATTAGYQVAERFELYLGGVELANGYHELNDADELRSRLTQVNIDRQADGRSTLPLPETLLAAMERGLPACAGCALGFDRLAMLACGAESIDEVIAIPG